MFKTPHSTQNVELKKKIQKNICRHSIEKNEKSHYLNKNKQEIHKHRMKHHINEKKEKEREETRKIKERSIYNYSLPTKKDLLRLLKPYVIEDISFIIISYS